MERNILTRAYMKLVKHINSIYKVCRCNFYIRYSLIRCSYADPDSIRVD